MILLKFHNHFYSAIVTPKCKNCTFMNEIILHFINVRWNLPGLEPKAIKSPGNCEGFLPLWAIVSIFFDLIHFRIWISCFISFSEFLFTCVVPVLQDFLLWLSPKTLRKCQQQFSVHNASILSLYNLKVKSWKKILPRYCLNYLRIGIDASWS